MGCVLYPVELLGLKGIGLPLVLQGKWWSGKDFNPLLHVRRDALSGELPDLKLVWLRLRRL